MAKDVLLKDDLVSGRQLIEGLRAKGFAISAAFWQRDEEGWRLYVISPDVDRRGSAASYSVLAEVLGDLFKDKTIEEQPTVDSAILRREDSEWARRRLRMAAGEGIDTGISMVPYDLPNRTPDGNSARAQ